MDGSAPLTQLGELLLIGILCAVVLTAAALYALRSMRQRGRIDRPLYPPPRTFKGRGTRTLEAPDLIAAQYRLDYALPDDVLVKVEMIDPGTGSSELILLKSGSGVEGFFVEAAGRYLFKVEPADENAQWSLTIKPVGLGPKRDW